MLRIFGLIFLGLLLIWNLRIVLMAFVIISNGGSGASPSYVIHHFMGTIGATALIAFLFVLLLRKTG